MNAQRLLKLADFLDTLPRAKFDFSTIMRVGGKRPLAALRNGAHRCGTVGCAIGWMPAVWPRQFVWNENNNVVSRDDSGSDCSFVTAERFFDISHDDSRDLFVPWGDVDTPGNRATPKMVAKHIRRWVAKQREVSA